MMPCCALSATSLVACVLTTMPSATGSVHEACGLGKPRPLPASGMSTRHWRQAPTGSSSGWSQKRGICDADLLGGADDQRVLGDADLDAVDRQRDGLDLGGGLLGGGRHAVGSHACARRRVEAAGSNGQPPWVRCARYSSRKYLIELEIGLVAPSPRAQNERPRMLSHWSSSRSRSASLALALLQPGQRLRQPPRALAARGALAAGLVLVELGPPQHRADDAGGLVEELQRARAEHRAGGADGLEVEGHVEVLRRQERGARAAGRPELQLVALAHAAGQVDQLAQGDAQRRLVLARAGDVARQAEDAVALGLLGAHRGEPGGAVGR